MRRYCFSIRGLAVLALAAVTGCASTQRSARFDTKEVRQGARPMATALADETELVEAEEAILEIHFLKVGQGDSTLIRCPNGDSLLVDCGSLGEFDRSAVRRYLRAHLSSDDSDIDLLVITHPDRDHYNKIETVLQSESGDPAIEVQRVVYVGDIDDHSGANFDQWLEDFPDHRKENLSESAFNVFPTRELEVCGDAVHVNVLAAGVESSFSSSNTASIVLLISYGTFDVILTGDATRDTQDDILRRFAGDRHVLRRVEILKVAHHGSRSTSMLARNRTDWFDAIKPEMVLFSAAKNNAHGHPNVEVAEALTCHTIAAASHPLKFWERRRVPSSRFTNHRFRKEGMFLTATNGNVVVTTNGDWYDWSWGR